MHPVRDPEDAVAPRRPDGALAVLGTEPIWDSQTSTHNQMMDEKGRVWFAARIRHPDNPDFCRKGSEPSVGEGVPARARDAASLDVRPGVGQVDADLHLLPDAPPDLRRGRQQHPVDLERSRRPGRRRLAQPQAVRGNRRRGARAGLDAVRPRHQRQRQARRMGRARASRSIRRRTSGSRSTSTRGRQPGRRIGLGHLARAVPQLRRARRARVRSRRTPRSPRSTSRRSPATARAAATSTATASSGCRSRAGTSEASTAASARGR